jgi:hypothetical protein
MKKAIDILPENTVYIFDNQPRNKQLIKQIKGMITRGHTVCIWPNTLYGKDINDMVKIGYDVEKIIHNNSYKGLEAELKLTIWRKV